MRAAAPWRLDALILVLIRGLVNELIEVSHAPVGSIPAGTSFIFLSFIFV